MACDSCKWSKRGYTIGLAVKDALRRDFADDGVKAQRIAVCMGCEMMLSTGNCRACGCFVHVKARFRRAFCDLGKW